MRAPVLLAALAASLLACTSLATSVEPTVIRVVMADDWASAPVVREVIDDFEREHDARVHVQAAPFSQIPDLVASAEQLGQPFDLAHWHAFAAAASGLAEPLDEAWAAAGLRADDYLPGALDDVTWQGSRYGIPLDTNALVLLAHGQALRAADLRTSDLRTPEGFLHAAERLVESGTVDHAMTVTSSSWAAYGWIRAMGGELVVFEDDGPRFTFDAPETVEAVQMLADIVGNGLAPRLYPGDLGDDAVQAFVEGSVALHATGSWDLRLAAGNGDDTMVVPLPQADPDDPHTVLGGSSLFVPVGARESELGFALALRLTEDEVALRLAEEEGRLPARSRVFEAPLFSEDPALATFVEQLPYARVMPLIAYPAVAAAFQEGYEDALAQRLGAREAMRRIQRYAEAWAEDG